MLKKKLPNSLNFGGGGGGGTLPERFKKNMKPNCLYSVKFAITVEIGNFPLDKDCSFIKA